MVKLSTLVSGVLLLAILPSVLSHSWIVCSKYTGDIFTDNRYDESKCAGFPRNWDRDGGLAPFGQERGQFITHDFRGGRRPNNRVCRGNLGQGYADRFPSATYVVGERVKLVWPAKNHGGPGRGCNTNHPDGLDLIFAYCGQRSGDPSFGELTRESPNLIADLKQTDKGFKNCLNFCSNTDRSPCQGGFNIPSNLSGRCTFVWLWELNRGEFYTSCWEADVTGGSAAIPTTSAPVVPSTSAPAPVTSAPPAPVTSAPPAPVTSSPTSAPAVPGAGRFIRASRFPQPIPVNGNFPVEVQWNLGSTNNGAKYVVVDVLSSFFFTFYGKGTLVENGSGATTVVRVSLNRQLREGETVTLKMYVVPKEAYDRDPNNAWRSPLIEGTTRVQASSSGRRELSVSSVDPVNSSSSVLMIAGVSIALTAFVVVAAALFIKRYRSKQTSNEFVQMVSGI